jgi:hypothetical protein
MRSDYSDVMEQRARRVSDAMADAVVLRPMRPPQSDTEFIEAARGFLYTTRPYRVMALAPMYPTSAYGVANTWPDGSVDLSDPNPPGLINYRPSKAAYAQLRHMLTSEPIDPPTGVPVDADGRIDGARVPLPVPGLNIGMWRRCTTRHVLPRRTGSRCTLDPTPRRPPLVWTWSLSRSKAAWVVS